MQAGAAPFLRMIFTNNPEVIRMKLYRLLALGLLALLLVACGKDEGAGEAGEPMTAKEVEKKTDKPDDALTAGVDALKENNLLGFVQTVLPPASLDKLREEFEESKSEMPPTEEQKAEFASTMDMLTREGAEDEMMAMLDNLGAKYYRRDTKKSLFVKLLAAAKDYADNE